METQMEAKQSRHGKTITGKSNKTSRTTQKAFRLDNTLVSRLCLLSIRWDCDEKSIVADALRFYLEMQNA